MIPLSIVVVTSYSSGTEEMPKSVQVPLAWNLWLRNIQSGCGSGPKSLEPLIIFWMTTEITKSGLTRQGQILKWGLSYTITSDHEKALWPLGQIVSFVNFPRALGQQGVLLQLRWFQGFSRRQLIGRRQILWVQVSWYRKRIAEIKNTGKSWGKINFTWKFRSPTIVLY